MASIVNPLEIWRTFRPLTIACLVAIAMLMALLIYLDTFYWNPIHTLSERDWWWYVWVYSSAAFKWGGQLVFPPVLLLLFGFFADRRLHFTEYAVARYGWRRVGAVAYGLSAATVLFIRIALFGGMHSILGTFIHFVGSVLPGLLLFGWWLLQWFRVRPAPSKS